MTNYTDVHLNEEIKPLQIQKQELGKILDSLSGDDDNLLFRLEDNLFALGCLYKNEEGIVQNYQYQARFTAKEVLDLIDGQEVESETYIADCKNIKEAFEAFLTFWMTPPNAFEYAVISDVTITEEQLYALEEGVLYFL